MPRSLTAELARVGLAVVIGSAGLTAYAAFRIWQQGQTDESGHPVDAIVVLGAAQYNGRPSPVFQARLDHAVSLFLGSHPAFFVVTGGSAPGDRFTEADTARAYAIAHGVPAAAILAETTGRDTLASLRNVADVLREHCLARALFVSDRTHMLRVLRIAGDLGIAAYGSPTRTSPSDADPLRAADAMAHEMGALVTYFFGR